MKTLLWLDDVRDPNVGTWLMAYAPQFAYGEGQVVWVKDYDSFCAWIKEHGMPDQISFDHDLGLDKFQSLRDKGMSKRGFKKLRQAGEFKSGKDAANWLVNYCLDNDVDLPKWGVHSANPTGADNIRSLLKNFEDFRKKN